MSSSRRWRRVNKIMGWNSAFNRLESKIIKRWYTTTDERHNHLDEIVTNELQRYSDCLSENAKRINKIPDEGDFCVIVDEGLHGYPIGEVVKIQSRFPYSDTTLEAVSHDGLEQLIRYNDIKVITQKEASKSWEGNYAEI